MTNRSTDFEDRLEQIKQMKTRAEVISDVKNGRYQKYPIILNSQEQKLMNEIIDSGMRAELLNALNMNIGCSVYEVILNKFGDDQLAELIYIHFVMYIDLAEEDGGYKLYRYAVNKKMACKYLLSLESSTETSIASETKSIVHASLIETFAMIDQKQSTDIETSRINIPKSMSQLMNLVEDKSRVLKFINPRKTQFLSYNFFAAQSIQYA